MNVQGKIFRKFDTDQVSERFKKREFVLEYVENPLYPQYILFQLVQDKVSILDGFEEGQSVDVHFNIQGRQWTSPQNEVKFFNTLQAWKILPSQQASNQPPPPPPVPVQTAAATTNGSSAPQGNGADENDDDLPF